MKGRDPWDRIEGESQEAYVRFLVYRNMGPRRTLDKAYRKFLREFYDGVEVHEKTRAPGSWQDDSVGHFWGERASAWDIRNLSAYGTKVAALHCEAVARLAAKTLRALAQTDPGDPGWRDILEGMKVVVVFLSPELVSAIESRIKPTRRAPVAAGVDRADVPAGAGGDPVGALGLVAAALANRVPPAGGGVGATGGGPGGDAVVPEPGAAE